MANPVVTGLTSNMSTSNSASVTSASISSFQAGDLIVVISAFNSDENFSSIATSGISIDGSWTNIPQNSSRPQVTVSYAKYSSGTGTITTTWTKKNSNPKHQHVHRVTGFDTTTPVEQSKTAYGDSTNPTMTFDASVDSGSTVMGGCCAGTSLPAPNQGIEEFSTTGNGKECSTMSDETSPGDTISWSPISSDDWSIVGIEINAAAVGAVAPTSHLYGPLAGSLGGPV